MTIIGRAVLEHQNAKARYEHEARAMKKDRPMTEVPFEWHTGQTKKAVKFSSYGWVPAVAIRWRKADGTIVPWCAGHEGDTLMIASEFVKGGGSE